MVLVGGFGGWLYDVTHPAKGSLTINILNEVEMSASSPSAVSPPAEVLYDPI